MFLGGRAPGNVHFHRILSRAHAIKVTYHYWWWPQPSGLRLSLSGFCTTVNLFFFSPFSNCLLEEDHLRSGSYVVDGRSYIKETFLSSPIYLSLHWIMCLHVYFILLVIVWHHLLYFVRVLLAGSCILLEYAYLCGFCFFVCWSSSVLYGTKRCSMLILAYFLPPS